MSKDIVSKMFDKDRLGYNKESKHGKDELLNKYAELAFKGDLEARNIIFYKYCYIVDKYVCQLYKKYMTTVNNVLDDSKLNLFITLDDIRQEFYLLLWRYINDFYNNLNNNREGKYISMSIHGFMQYYYDKKVKKINYLFADDYLEEITDRSVNDDYKSVEINDLLEIIESNMCDNLKGVLSLIKMGYTYKEIANMYGLTSSRIGQVFYEGKKIVNDKELSFSN